MKILFDQGTPVPLRRYLANTWFRPPSIWAGRNSPIGELLTAAEDQFDAFVTTDENLRYQQNLSGRRIAIVILPFASWPKLQTLTARIAAIIDGHPAR